jgi:hypothetical protein
MYAWNEGGTSHMSCTLSLSREALPVTGMVRRRSLEDVECGARRHLMKIYASGIDLGKTVFHLVGLDASGQVPSDAARLYDYR